jgi:hypothetical protein
MHNSVVQLPNVSNYIAFMHGPIVLAAPTGTTDLTGLVAGDSRWGHIAGGKKLPLNEAPVIIEDDAASLPDKLIPVSGKPLTFRFRNVKMANNTDLELEPFYKIHDSRYQMYWMHLSESQYQSFSDSLAQAEQQKLAVQKRTVDFVAPGEQQPEADHFIQKENSGTGNHQDEFWRDARNGGYFSYRLNTNKETSLSLLIRYWGNEKGPRAFDIYIDDVKLASENLTGKWNSNEFQQVEYPIPDTLISGKINVRIKFVPQPGNIAGSVYYLRLLRK